RDLGQAAYDAAPQHRQELPLEIRPARRASAHGKMAADRLSTLQGANTGARDPHDILSGDGRKLGDLEARLERDMPHAQIGAERLAQDDLLEKALQFRALVARSDRDVGPHDALRANLDERPSVASFGRRRPRRKERERTGPNHRRHRPRYSARPSV